MLRGWRLWQRIHYNNEPNINTSSDVGGQVNKLSEAFPPEVATEVVLFIGTIVEESMVMIFDTRTKICLDRKDLKYFEFVS